MSLWYWILFIMGEKVEKMKVKGWEKAADWSCYVTWGWIYLIPKALMSASSTPSASGSNYQACPIPEFSLRRCGEKEVWWKLALKTRNPRWISWFSNTQQTVPVKWMKHSSTQSIRVYWLDAVSENTWVNMIIGVMFKWLACQWFQECKHEWEQ